MLKIAIIMTSIFENYIISLLKKLDFQCKFSYHIYEDFSDIPVIFQNCCNDIDGIITTGFFPSQVIKSSFPETTKVINEINVDDADVYHFLLRILEKHKNLEIKSIYADFTDLLNMSLYDYIFRDRERSYAEDLYEKYKDFDVSRLIELEHLVYEKHLRLYREGKSKVSITRFSSLVPRLSKHGIETHFIMPSQPYIERVLSETIHAIELQFMKDSQPAIVNISVDSVKEYDVLDLSCEQKISDLYKHINAFCNERIAKFVINKNRYGYDLFISKKFLEIITNGFKEDQLGELLRAKLDFKFYIGYGIGSDIYQAKLNAMNSVKESMFSKKSSSYIITENDEMIGPLGEAERVAINIEDSELISATAAKSNLSTYTIKKVLAVGRIMPDGKVTAKELSNKLSITTRSANRILKALSSCNIVSVVGEKKLLTKGRPEKVYRINCDA